MMGGWGEFVAVFIMFFVTHSVPVRPSIKARLVALLGARGFSAFYGSLSTVMLALVIIAAGRAPYVGLWDWAPWQNHATLIGLFLAIMLAALSIGRPNPLSFGGAHNETFNPDEAGIIGLTRHPLLGVLLLWSACHLIPNGNLAHVLMFGTFAVFSLLGMRIIDRRKRRILGPGVWRTLSMTTLNIGFSRNGLMRVAIGGIIYLAIILGHEAVIGVTPIP